MPATIRLIATDLDGTLLQPDGTVSPRARAALRAARARGLRIVLVTGRPPRGVRSLALGDYAEVAICANGALTYDPAADRLLEQRPIPSRRDAAAGLRPASGRPRRRLRGRDRPGVPA